MIKGVIISSLKILKIKSQQTFNTKWVLKIHSRIHSGEKPFVCNYNECNHKFRHKSNLNSNMKQHLGIKRHKCYYNECHYSFVKINKMKRHMFFKQNKS